MAEGGVGHGKNDFSPEFREYIERELYDSSRVKSVEFFGEDGGWVFWDRRDGFPDLTLPNDLSGDFNPNLHPSLRVRLRIRRALHELLAKDLLWGCLIQFWAPTKTLEGRTYLTVQNQPFALGICCPSDREAFCQYRMGICDLFNAYAESAEEHLELPARVFLRKLPGFPPYYRSSYTLEEHPQHDHTPCWPMWTSWALPVFDYDSYTCVGVLDMVSHLQYPSWLFGRFLYYMGKILQEFGLSCPDESINRRLQCEDKNKARMAAVEELQVACKSVSKIDGVCSALAWISCHYCSDLLQLLCKDHPPLMEFNENFYHRKVQVIGSKLPSSNLLYCSDVSQLSLYESLLELVDDFDEVGGCFTMCLRTRNAAELYVAQFFLSAPANNDKNKLTKFRLIMDTMKGFSKTFRLANGQDWGEGLCLEVIDFQNHRKIHSTVRISATGCTPGLEFLNDEPVKLQQGLPYQPSVDSIDTCMYSVIESQNSNSLSLGSLPDGIEVILLDSSSQKGHSADSVPATRFPSQWRHPTADSVNNCITEARSSYTISDPSLDSFSNGIAIMQLDLSDQASVDPSNFFVYQGQRVELGFDDRTSAVGAFRNTGIQDANTVTIKAQLENCDHLLQFSLSLPPRLVELQDKVAERKPEAGACDVFSIDKDKRSILIGCDDELQQWIDKSSSLGNTSTRVFLRPKQPIPT